MKNSCLTKVLSFWVAQLPQILSLCPCFGNCSCFEQPRLLSVLTLCASHRVKHFVFPFWRCCPACPGAGKAGGLRAVVLQVGPAADSALESSPGSFPKAFPICQCRWEYQRAVRVCQKDVHPLHLIASSPEVKF